MEAVSVLSVLELKQPNSLKILNKIPTKNLMATF